MCKEWLSSIMFTLSKRCGINSGSPLNRAAFCLLTGIPDIWSRAQTSRATELIVALNSLNSHAGLTTRARLCAIMKKKNIVLAVKALATKKKFSRRSGCRMVGTLRYLKHLGVTILNRETVTNHDLTLLLDSLTASMKHAMRAGFNVIVYTDGSTDTKARTRQVEYI